jgi:hypothetical protein
LATVCPAIFGLAVWAVPAIFGRMANVDDIDRPGGWLVEETIRGSNLKRYFKVYELDEEKAVELARAYGATGSARAMKSLNVHEFTGDDMQPGDVKQHG